MKKPIGQEYIAPWEHAFERMLSPIEEFIKRQTTGAIFLMICTAIALLLANSPMRDYYHHFFQTTFTVGSPQFHISMTLHQWVNEGLMVIFFFVVGLELKREILLGEFANLKKAMLPIVAALGGMIMPALIYVYINPTGYLLHGWGIPMATDIAFSLGVLALLGARVPKKLLVFLVAVAIVDDLGAVLIIALFYTNELNFVALIVASLLIFLLLSLNLSGVRRGLPYMLIGLPLWLAMLDSGVHPTLAGIFLAFSIPLYPKYNPDRFFYLTHRLLKDIKKTYKKEANIYTNQPLRVKIRALGEGVKLVQAPAQNIERRMHIPSAYIIVPIFALANAGIDVNLSVLSNLLTHPVSLGVSTGLVIGKLFGIAGFSWVALKTGCCRLPTGLNFKHIIGTGLLAGIGFTMSIFISDLAFSQYPEILLMAKSGTLFASLVAGAAGYSWLYWCSRIKN